MDTFKRRINTKAFAENLTDTLQDIKETELTLPEKKKVLSELEDLEVRMKKLKKSL